MCLCTRIDIHYDIPNWLRTCTDMSCSNTRHSYREGQYELLQTVGVTMATHMKAMKKAMKVMKKALEDLIIIPRTQDDRSDNHHV